MHTRNFFVPSRNYSHVHGNVLHANFLVSISSFIYPISFVYHCHLTMNKTMNAHELTELITQVNRINLLKM